MLGRLDLVAIVDRLEVVDMGFLALVVPCITAEAPCKEVDRPSWVATSLAVRFNHSIVVGVPFATAVGTQVVP